MIIVLYLPMLCHQVVETLRVDDGMASGWAANADTSFREAVFLGVPDSAKILGLMFYPADPDGFLPRLNYMVWAPNDSSKPGDLIGQGVADNLDPDQWNYINVEDQNIWVDEAGVFVGWRTTGDTLYYNWYDSFLNGYNWWFDGVFWKQDSTFPGDFMIRAVAEVHYSVNEGQEQVLPGFRVFPGSPYGPVRLRLSLNRDGHVGIACHDQLGRLAFEMEGEFSAGVHDIIINPGLHRGIYIVSVNGPPGLSGNQRLIIN